MICKSRGMYYNNIGDRNDQASKKKSNSGIYHISLHGINKLQIFEAG